MIYFAALPSGSIKIGFTENLDQRMESLAEYLTESLRPIVARDFQKAPKPGEGLSR